MNKLFVVAGLLMATVCGVAQVSSPSPASKTESRVDPAVLNLAAWPLFDAVVTKKLHIDDSFEAAQQVFAYAGLVAVAGEKGVTGRSLDAFYRTGPRGGIAVHLEFNSQKRIVAMQTSSELDSGLR